MQLIDFLNEKDRFAKSIGAQLTELREGYSRAELTVESVISMAQTCVRAVSSTLLPTLRSLAWQMVTDL